MSSPCGSCDGGDAATASGVGGSGGGSAGTTLADLTERHAGLTDIWQRCTAVMGEAAARLAPLDHKDVEVVIVCSFSLCVCLSLSPCLCLAVSLSLCLSLCLSLIICRILIEMLTLLSECASPTCLSVDGPTASRRGHDVLCLNRQSHTVCVASEAGDAAGRFCRRRRRCCCCGPAAV